MVVLALPVFRFVEPCEPSYPARVAGYDDLGIWHDPGNGQFAKPGWSTAKGLVLDMVGDLLNSAREHVRHAPEGRALTVKDSRLTGIGVGAGDNVRVRYLNDEFGIVDVRRSGERRPHLVPWSRFSDTIPDPSAPVVDNPEFVNAPAVHEESSGLVDRLAANGGVGFVEVVGNDLNRYGVAAGSVLEARLGDDGAVTVTTPDGTRFRVPSRLVEPSIAPPDTPRTTEPGSAPDDVSAHTGVHVDDRREDSVGVPDRPSTPDIEAEPDDVDEADGSEPLTPPTTPEPDDEPDVQAEPEPEPGPDPIQEPDKIDEIPDPDIDPDEPEIPDDEDDGEVPVPRVGTREAWIADAVADHGVTREQVLDAYRDITGLRAEMRRQARAAQVPLLQTIDRVDALKVARPPAKKPVKQADGRTVWTRGAGSGEWDWFDHLGKAERNRIRNKWMVATRGEESAQASYAPDQLQQNIELAGVSGDVSTVDGAMQWWLDQIRMIDGLGNIALGRSAFNMDALGIELDGVKPSDILGRDRWDAAGAVAAARAEAAERYSSEEADMASQYLAAAYRAPEGERPWEIGYVRWVAELDDYLDAADAYEQDGRPVPDDITERIEQLLPLGSDPDQSLEEMYSDIAEMARAAGETVTGGGDGETGVSEHGQGDTPADRSAETDMRPEATDSADGGSPGAHTDAAEPPPIPFHRPTKRMSPTSVGNMVAAGEPLWHYSEVADDAQSMALLRTQVAVNMYDPAELSEDMDGPLGTLLWRENRGYKLSPDDVSMLGVARHEPEAVGRLFAKFRRQYEGKAANSKIPAEVELSADVRADAHAAWTETVTHPALVAAFDTIGVDPPNMILSRWREPWDDDRDANGTYTAGSNTVWINSTDFWGGISAGLSDEEARSFPISITERAPAAIGAATTSGGDRRGVMVHETGHYVHDHLAAAGGGFVGTPLADEWKQMWGAYHGAYIAATEAASGVPGGIAGLHRKQLSFYSHENFKEGFAETFGLVARGADPEGLDPEGRALFDWMSTNVFGLAPGESFADIEVGQTYSVNGVKIERTANGYVDVATGEPVNANGRPL